MILVTEINFSRLFSVVVGISLHFPIFTIIVKQDGVNPQGVLLGTFKLKSLGINDLSLSSLTPPYNVDPRSTKECIHPTFTSVSFLI